ncbi:hypothetical protein PJK45_21470 [Mycobacterium kansasii]
MTTKRDRVAARTRIGSSAPVEARDDVNGLEATQRTRLDRAARDAERLYPDNPELRRVALEAAADYLLGRTDACGVGAELARVRRQERRIRARVRQIAVMAVADGHSEHSVARQIGVNRINLRRWLGKPAKTLTHTQHR